jgi:hypothetical protein
MQRSLPLLWPWRAALGTGGGTGERSSPGVVRKTFRWRSDIPQRILNGFAVLRLDGSNITETFYDEKGGGGWP